MSDNPSNQQNTTTDSGYKDKSPGVIQITADDLPLCCPLPGKTLWSQHPRVFIPLEDGEGHCPYCGNRFALKP